MGLDVYLYYIKDRDEINRKKRIFEEHAPKIWEVAGGEKNLSSEERNEVLKAFDVFGNLLGLDRWGNTSENKHIEIPSSIHPEHIFKIGYFRSSYNDSGVEKVLGNLGVGNLSYIFGEEKGGYEYEAPPNWKRSLEKVTTEIALLRTKPPIRCLQITTDPKTEVINPPEAMETYMKNWESGKNRLGSFSNRDGDFFFSQPMKVRGLIRGMTQNFWNKDLEPCVNVVYEVDDNKFYEEALEIVKETCEWVLSKEDPHNYYLHWSA